MEERNENVMTYEVNENINTELEEVNVETEDEAVEINYKAIGLGAAAVIGGIYAIKRWVAPKVKTWNEGRLAKKGYVKLQPGEMIVRAEVEEVLEDAVETEDEK